jgi:hypothetical protein
MPPVRTVVLRLIQKRRIRIVKINIPIRVSTDKHLNVLYTRQNDYIQMLLKTPKSEQVYVKKMLKEINVEIKTLEANLSNALDMSAVARYKRAQAIGFDVKHLFVHVSPHALPKTLCKGVTTYFTENLEYAKRYANPTASSYGGKDISYYENLSPNSTPVFINKSRIFDTRKAKDRKIFETRFLNRYGNGTELCKSGLPDWTDAEDFAEFFFDCSLKYDGVIVDEGGDPNPDVEYSSIHRGISYAVFDLNCVRSIFAKFDPLSKVKNTLMSSSTSAISVTKAARMARAKRMGFDTRHI